jgi:flavin-dependent dehydrogenase
MGRVLVVGAGVAAFAAALRCAREGLDATVLIPARRQLPEFAETLSAGGFRTLVKLGLPRRDIARNFPEVREHRSRWGDSPMQVKPRIPGLQNPVILGKASLIAMLRTAALENGAQVLCIDRLAAASEMDSGVLVSVMKDGSTQELACHYAIDASGRPAVLARQLGTKRATLDDLVAFSIHGPARPAFAACVATVSIADGWTFWASDAAGQATFAFFTAGRKLDGQVNATRLLSRVPAEIMKMMARPEVWAASEVQPFNCSTSALEQTCGDFWLACGDALQTFDPLASMGVATALKQADASAQAIAAATLGDRSMIASYSEQAQLTLKRYIVERNAYYGHP